MGKGMPASTPAQSSGPSRAEFTAAYREHVGFVWRELVRQGAPSASLEDALQEVFVVTHRHWGVWEGRVSMRSWLFGVARRVAANQRRTLSRHRHKLDSMPTPPPERAFDEQLAARDRLDVLARVVEQLEPERREVFVLAELEGWSAPEIADALQIKLNTVYSRLRRARASVMATMAEHDADQPNRSDHGRAR
jgi:RNA polymerase sigma-70 factor (ECF subfamily)